jgi:hypothetical protein
VSERPPESNFALLQAISELDRKNEARYSELRGEIRSVRQTLDESIKPTLMEHESTIEQLRARFVYALTVIGSALGAVVFLYFKGISP